MHNEQNNSPFNSTNWHATTILAVRKDGQVVIAGDGQVSMGQTVLKSNAKKIRRLGKDGKIIVGFAGATADAFTLFERLEAKLEAHPGQLTRACVELAPDWRVMAQVSMGEILSSPSGEAYRAINSKRVDLLIVGPDDHALHAIEYQGSGHHLGPAATRDAVKKEALRKAGVSYVEVKSGDTPTEIRTQLAKLAGTAPVNRAMILDKG